MRRYTIVKIVSQREEDLDRDWAHRARHMFMEALAELRRECPEGDLVIRLSIDAPEKTHDAS